MDKVINTYEKIYYRFCVVVFVWVGLNAIAYCTFPRHFLNNIIMFNNDAQSKQTICVYIVSVYIFFYHIRLFVVISEAMLCLFVLNLQFAYADFRSSPLWNSLRLFLSWLASRFGGEREKERRENCWFNLAPELDDIFAPNYKSRLSCIYI